MPTDRLPRIPYDSLVLAAVAGELGELVGAKCQRVVNLGTLEVAVSLYVSGSEHWLLLSANPVYARAHLLPSRPAIRSADDFVRLCRGRLEGSRLRSVHQVGFDRILRLEFETAGGTATLIAELMGKHSNLILIDETDRIVACAKTVGPSKSKRPVVVGRTYSPPPFEPRQSLLDARSWPDAESAEGASPFLLRWLRAVSGGEFAIARKSLDDLRMRAVTGHWSPVAAPGFGAYPVDVAALGYGTEPVESISAGVAAHFGTEAAAADLDHAKRDLAAKFDRVLLSRQAALHDLNLASEAADRAGELQAQADLILAYAHQLEPGASVLRAWDLEGRPVEIPLLEEKSPQENAQRLYNKARRAKANQGQVLEQRARIGKDLLELEAAIDDLERAADVDAVEKLRELAVARRWVQGQAAPKTGSSASTPFEGHRIRSLLAPGGWTVLYGENASSNDYLTVRVAKPNDWWLHVRGAVSAHVVIQTGNQPQRVPTETFNFAAEVAVRNSPSKHSGYVAVDLTLKKYVRKPKGAPAGTALYTHERTLHVELDKR